MKVAKISSQELMASPAAMIEPAQLSVIIPTFNEAQNVRETVRRLDRTLRGISWEAIFVDETRRTVRPPP